MKRKVLALLFVVLLCVSMALPVFADTVPAQVVDDADLLSSEEERELDEKLQTVSQKNELQMYIITVENAPNDDVDAYVEYIYDSESLGEGANRDGVLLLVCMDPREYRILSNGYAGTAIDMDTIDTIGDAFVSDLSDGNYADAFHTFIDECDYYLDGYRNGYPFNFGKTLVICLIIGVVVGLIVVLIMKAQLKSVRKQHQANAYVKSGSMKVTVSNDIFLYRNVSRTKKQSSSSSGSGGGGSRSVGGGSF